ncbi:MAG TPA: hypothetical protein VJ349_22800 [Stellaceae bacterium]|nr:hypothetical protein [Stellaceae bacterium]
MLLGNCPAPALEERVVLGEAIPHRRAPVPVFTQIQIPGNHLGRIEGHLEAVPGGNQLTVGFLKLPGSFSHEFFEAVGGLLSLNQISGCFVLPAARPQRRIGRADKGHRLDGTLLERHVAQHFQQTLDMLVPSRVIAAGRQDNKREIRPGRLVAYPIKKRGRIGSEKSFFGNDPRAGSGL